MKNRRLNDKGKVLVISLILCVSLIILLIIFPHSYTKQGKVVAVHKNIIVIEDNRGVEYEYKNENEFNENDIVEMTIIDKSNDKCVNEEVIKVK